MVWNFLPKGRIPYVCIILTSFLNSYICITHYWETKLCMHWVDGKCSMLNKMLNASVSSPHTLHQWSTVGSLSQCGGYRDSWLHLRRWTEPVNCHCQSPLTAQLECGLGQRKTWYPARRERDRDSQVVCGFSLNVLLAWCPQKFIYLNTVFYQCV